MKKLSAIRSNLALAVLALGISATSARADVVDDGLTAIGGLVTSAEGATTIVVSIVVLFTGWRLLKKVGSRI